MSSVLLSISQKGRVQQRQDAVKAVFRPNKFIYVNITAMETRTNRIIKSYPESEITENMQ